jgi:hypothetical protein
MGDPSGPGTVDKQLAAILARDPRSDVPAGLLAMFRFDERALVVFRGVSGAVVATNKRVLVERLTRPTGVFELHELTGAIAQIGVFLRYLVITGPGLPTEIGRPRVGMPSNATLIRVWQVREARRAAADITRIVAMANQVGSVQD